MHGDQNRGDAALTLCCQQGAAVEALGRPLTHRRGTVCEQQRSGGTGSLASSPHSSLTTGCYVHGEQHVGLASSPARIEPMQGNQMFRFPYLVRS